MEEEIDVYDEKKLVFYCILAIQGIESSFIGWGEYENFQLLDFGVKYKINPEDVKKIDPNIIKNQENQIKNSRQLNKIKKKGLRVREKFRKNSLSPSQLELIDKICYLGNLVIEIKYLLGEYSKFNQLKVASCLFSLFNSEFGNFYQFLSGNFENYSIRQLYVLLLPFIREFRLIYLILTQLRPNPNHLSATSLLNLLFNLASHSNPSGLFLIFTFISPSFCKIKSVFFLPNSCFSEN